MKKLLITGIAFSILLIPPIPMYASLAPFEIECASGGGEGEWEEAGGDSLLSDINDIASFFTDLISGLVGSFNIAKVVDIHKVFTEIMSGNLPEEVAVSNAAENNLPNSYAHRKDRAETLQRKAAIATVEDTTLGEQAQQQTLENCLFVNDATNIIFELGEDSQNLDTSQQILQNISGQLGQKGTIDHLMKEELTLIRQDLALSTVLEAQIAEELHQRNLSERRAHIASKNLVILQNGLVTLPGGLWQEE
jgi:hypothetical protein